MNLNSPERLQALIQPYQFHGETLHLRKLPADVWRWLIDERIKIVKVGPDGEPTDERDGWDWSCLALSKQLCNAEGALTHDSDDQRACLKSLTVEEMRDMLTAAQKWSGVYREAEEQKKS